MPQNQQFIGLLENIAALNITAAAPDDGGELSVKHLDNSAMNQLKQSSENDKTLADLVALSIGQIGENILAKKSTIFHTNCEDTHLIGFTHPSGDIRKGFCYGKYGILLAIYKNPNIGKLPPDQNLQSFGRQLC